MASPNRICRCILWRGGGPRWLWGWRFARPPPGRQRGGARPVLLGGVFFRAPWGGTEGGRRKYNEKTRRPEQMSPPPRRPRGGGEQPSPADPAAARVPTFEESRADIETLLYGQKSLDA